jgi:uncharacterized membrane protein SirB2
MFGLGLEGKCAYGQFANYPTSTMQRGIGIAQFYCGNAVGKWIMRNETTVDGSRIIERMSQDNLPGNAAELIGHMLERFHETHRRELPEIQRWNRAANPRSGSVLLFSEIALAWQLGYTLMNSPWLAAKIVALLVYISLGMVAIRIAKTAAIQLTEYLAAQLAFFHIVATAITHEPFPQF